MTRFALLIAFLLGANLLLTLALLVANLTSSVPVESVTALGPIFVFSGIVVALFTLFINLQRASSDDLLKTAIDLLEKAFDTLDRGTGQLPSNERHSWLFAARMIRTAEELSTQLTHESHHVIYSKMKEYWRANLYDLVFRSIDGLPSDFYAEKPEHMDGWSGQITREPLSEKSLVYIYGFIKWPEGLQDPIKDVPIFSRDDVKRMCFSGPRGLGDLFGKVHQIRNKRSASANNG